MKSEGDVRFEPVDSIDIKWPPWSARPTHPK